MSTWRDRLADDLQLGRLLQRRPAGRLEVEPLAADQLAVGRPLRGVGRADDGALARDERVCRHAELLGGHLDQGLPRLGAAPAETAAEVRLHRLATGRRALVRREPRVRLDQVDHADRHVELVGGDLHLRRPQAGAELRPCR